MTDGAGKQLRVLEEDVPPPSRSNDALIVIASCLSGIGGLVFGAALLLGAPTWLSGGALAIGLMALAITVRRYFADRFPDVEAVEPRHLGDPTDTDESPISAVPAVARPPLARRALLAAAAFFGIGLLAPVASLGPSPGNTLRRTRWRNGKRLVTTDGSFVRPQDVAVGGISQIWPEDAIGHERSSVVLLRLSSPPKNPTNGEWIVDQRVVGYSKVCTHAGCPVALFRERDNALFCPCHQSTFDAAQGAVPTFGPAARALPQLPLGLDDEGFLVALGDFQEQVGPAFG